MGVTTAVGSAPFYAGSTLTLRCSVQVDVTVDILHSVTLTWLRSGTAIRSNNRITMSNLTQLTPYTHEATLDLSPLSISDTGTFACQVTVSLDPAITHVLGASQTYTEAIIVQSNLCLHINTL